MISRKNSLWPCLNYAFVQNFRNNGIFLIKINYIICLIFYQPLLLVDAVGWKFATLIGNNYVFTLRAFPFIPCALTTIVRPLETALNKTAYLAEVL